MIGHVGFRVFRRRRDIIRNPLKPGAGRDINQLMDQFERQLSKFLGFESRGSILPSFCKI
jgi:hypothetical protein